MTSIYPPEKDGEIVSYKLMACLDTDSDFLTISKELRYTVYVRM